MRRTAWPLMAGVAILTLGVARADERADAQAIVDRAIKAVGGEEKLAKYKTHTWTEKGNYHGMGGALPFTGQYAVQWPDKFRMEIQGFFTLVLNGDKGWTSMSGSTEEMSKEQLAEQKENTFSGYVSTLLPLKDKAFRLLPMGEGKVGDRAALIVKVTHDGHRDVLLFFDKDKHWLIKSEYTAKAQEQGGQEVKQEVFLTDYKDVNGVKFPTKLVIKRDGKDYVEAENSDFKPVAKPDDKMFAKP